MAKPTATTKAIWKDRLKRWEESKLTAEEFASREGVKPSSLKWWRWRLASEVQRSRARRARPAAASAFVEVAAEPPREKRDAQPFEVVLGNGRVVRVPPGFCGDELGRLLAVAEGDGR